MDRVNIIIYVFVGIVLGGYVFRYTEHIAYAIGIVVSFAVLNGLVIFQYKRFEDKSTVIMKFMGLNFLKDFLWAGIWMFLIKANVPLTLFLAGIFILLSIPIYRYVLKNTKNN